MVSFDCCPCLITSYHHFKITTNNNNTTKGGGTGTFVIKTHPEWAPIGAERFETLSSNGFFEGCRIFRVLPGFVSQFGINGDPDLQR